VKFKKLKIENKIHDTQIPVITISVSSEKLLMVSQKFLMVGVPEKTKNRKRVSQNNLI